MYLKDIRKQFFSALVFLALMTFVLPASAIQVEWQLGGGLMNFDYVEYDDDNVFLDGESGLIPGAIVKLKLQGNKVYGAFNWQLYGNKVEYDGQTQGGVPAKTDSIAIIFDTDARVGFNFNEARNHAIYFGLGFRYWYREILSGRDIYGNPVSGLLEEYYWNYGIAGYEASFAVSEKTSIGFDFRYTKMLNGKMDVEFGDFDAAQVNLGNEHGIRFSFPVKMKARGGSVIVTPYYESIDIGKSNTVRLTQGGVLSNTLIHEPRSETRNVGIEIMWMW